MRIPSNHDHGSRPNLGVGVLVRIQHDVVDSDVGVVTVSGHIAPETHTINCCWQAQLDLPPTHPSAALGPALLPKAIAPHLHPQTHGSPTPNPEGKGQVGHVGAWEKRACQEHLHRDMSEMLRKEARPTFLVNAQGTSDFQKFDVATAYE